MILLIGLCALFTLVIKSNYAGIWCGFGISLSSLIYFGILCLYLRYRLKINFKFHKYYWQTINRVFKNSYKQLLIIVTIQIFKAIALICLGLIITDTIEGLVPISYQLSRVIWYNLLYILPFLGYGIADAILFYGFYEQDTFDVKHFNNILVIIFSVVFVFEIILSIGVYYLIPKLAEMYLVNNDPNEFLKEIDISSVQIAPLLNSLLKKESFIDTLNSFDEQSIIDAIKKMSKLPDFIINPIASKIASNIIQLRDQFVNIDTREEAIIKFVGLISGDETIDLAVKKFFASYLQNAKVESVNEMFSIKNCNTYYFMVIWTTLYSCGLIFNNAKIVLRKNAVSWWQALLISLVQAIVIAAVVVIGITQQYSNALPMYDAWTMPLCVAGIIIFGYYLVTYLIWYKKALKLHNKNIVNNLVFKWM
ncbi:MAG: hypothetical protein K2L64_01060 [Ureaplasma sp.]|nr:hypothetical protein [Ureaplasma sp.]